MYSFENIDISPFVLISQRINIKYIIKTETLTFWLLKPQKTLGLYETILKPKLTYTALVWWKTFGNKTSIKVLDHVQAVTLRGILETRRSAPTAAVRKKGTGLGMQPF